MVVVEASGNPEAVPQHHVRGLCNFRNFNGSKSSKSTVGVVCMLTATPTLYIFAALIDIPQSTTARDVVVPPQVVTLH